MWLFNNVYAMYFHVIQLYEYYHEYHGSYSRLVHINSIQEWQCDFIKIYNIILADSIFQEDNISDV